MLSSGMNYYHLKLMLSSGTKCYRLWWNVIIWDAMLSSGANVINWDKMLSSEANVIMVSSGSNVIIWCYHVMLSSGMITPPFFVFPGNFTHSWSGRQMASRIICPGSISKLSIQTQQYSFVSDLEVFNPEKLFYFDKFPTVYISWVLSERTKNHLLKTSEHVPDF